MIDEHYRRRLGTEFATPCAACAARATIVKRSGTAVDLETVFPTAHSFGLSIDPNMRSAFVKTSITETVPTLLDGNVGTAAALADQSFVFIVIVIFAHLSPSVGQMEISTRGKFLSSNRLAKIEVICESSSQPIPLS